MTNVRPVPGITLRDLRPADLDRAVALLTSYSAFDNRRQLRSLLTSPDPDRVVVVADRAGAVAGVSALTTVHTLPDASSARVAVDESERGKGIGVVLADAIRDRIRSGVRFHAVTCAIRDDLPRPRRFAEGYGLVLTNHHLGWRLDLTGARQELEHRAAETARAAGVRLRRTDIESEQDRILDCLNRTLTGLPLPFGDNQQVAVERLRTSIPRNAEVFLAEASDDPSVACGLSVVSPQEAGTAWYVNFTGVDARRRRSGVGRALKAAVAYAAHCTGASSIESHNDETSEAVTRLNLSLGMTPIAGYWTMARLLR